MYACMHALRNSSSSGSSSGTGQRITAAAADAAIRFVTIGTVLYLTVHAVRHCTYSS